MAWAYREAAARGENPGKTLARDSETPQGTVNRWIAKARKLKYLPPGEPWASDRAAAAGRAREGDRLMASAWISTRTIGDGSERYRVEYRTGGREAVMRYGGSFKTLREATIRKNWIAGELAALRVPDLSTRQRRTGRLAEARRGR